MIKENLEITFYAKIPDEDEEDIVDIIAEPYAEISSVSENCEEDGINGPPYDIGETAHFRYYTNRPDLPITAGATNGTVVVSDVPEIEGSACEVVFIAEAIGELRNMATQVTGYWWKGTVDGLEPRPIIEGLKVTLPFPVTGVLVIAYDREFREVLATPEEYAPNPVYIQICQVDLAILDSYEVEEKTCCAQCDSEDMHIYYQTGLVDDEVVDVDPSAHVRFTISGGCPPYTWGAAGDWLRMITDVQAPRKFESDPIEWIPGPPSEELENLLVVDVCACRDTYEGAEGSVAVTDDCGITVEVEIQIDHVCCKGDLKVNTLWTPVDIYDIPENFAWVGVIPVDPAECTNYHWSVKEGDGVEFRDHDTGSLVCLHRSNTEILCGPILVRCEDDCGRYCDIPVTEHPRNTCCRHYDYPEPWSDATLPVERDKWYILNFRGGKPPYTWLTLPLEQEGWELWWGLTNAPTNFIKAGTEVCTNQACTVEMEDACERTASKTVQVDELEFAWHPDNPTEFPPEGEAVFRVVGGALDMLWTPIDSDDFYIESTDPEYPETGPLPVGREIIVKADDPCAVATGGFTLKVEDACEVKLECHVHSEPLEFKWHEDTWTGTYGFGYAELYVENGVPPFQWEVVSGDGHIVTLETWDRHNVVFRDECAEGTIKVSCQDDCLDTIETDILLPESAPMECSDINPEVIGPGDEKEVAIIYGTGPFTWEVTGGDCSLAYAQTNYRSNILRGPDGCSTDPGNAVITVTDKCNREVLCTVGVAGDGHFAGDPANPTAFTSSYATVAVIGGKSPFSWAVNAGFTMSFPETVGRSNQINIDGTCSQYTRCTVTVTESCGKETTFGLAPPFPEVLLNGEDAIFHGESTVVYADGGMEPFTWDISGQGFALVEPDGTDRVNTVIPLDECFPADEVIVTATDDCDKFDTHTIAVVGDDGPLQVIANKEEVSALQLVTLSTTGTGKSPYEWTATSGFKLLAEVTNSGDNKMYGTDKCATGSVVVTITDYCERVSQLEIPITAIEDMVMTLPAQYTTPVQDVSVAGGRAGYVWSVSEGWVLTQEVTGSGDNKIAEVDPCTEEITVSAEGACGDTDSKQMAKTLPTMTWDGPETMDGSCSIAVIGGTAPFHWEVSSGFALGAEDTNSPYNTVSTVDGYCGVAHVIVTDRCGKTTEGYILTVGGAWVETCRNGPYHAECGGSGPGNNVEYIQGGKKVVAYSACLPENWDDGVCPSCPACTSCEGFTYCAQPEHCSGGQWCHGYYGVIFVYNWQCI